jgi:hypothetical protein
VVSEENSTRDAIKSVRLGADSENGYARIEFSKGEGTDIILGADDRDVALLLSSDIKDYIRAEVLRGWLTKVATL